MCKYEWLSSGSGGNSGSTIIEATAAFENSTVETELGKDAVAAVILTGATVTVKEAISAEENATITGKETAFLNAKDDGTGYTLDLYTPESTGTYTYTFVIPAANLTAANGYKISGDLTVKLTVIVKEQEESDTVNKEDLKAAITAATEAKNGVKVSIDGSDVATTEKWVLQSDIDTLAAAITAAQAVVDDAEATQDEVDGAVDTLAEAVEAFEDAKQDGTKEEETTDDTEKPVVTATSQTVTNVTGQTVTVKSNESGKVYIVLGRETVADVDDLDALVAAKKAAYQQATANTDTEISTEGLLVGEYYAYAVDAAGNISEKGTNDIKVLQVVGSAAAPTVTSVSVIDSTTARVTVETDGDFIIAYAVEEGMDMQGFYFDSDDGVAGGWVAVYTNNQNQYSKGRTATMSISPASNTADIPTARLLPGTYYIYVIDEDVNVSAKSVGSFTKTDEKTAVVSGNVRGTVGQETNENSLYISLTNDLFTGVAVGDDITSWFINMPHGLTAKITRASVEWDKDGIVSLFVEVSGTPEAAVNEAIAITIPADKMTDCGTDLTTETNDSAKFSIEAAE